MARKPRNHKLEQQRRNELARQRGFTSRGQQRRAIERGKVPALAPTRLRSERTIKAQTERQIREQQSGLGGTITRDFRTKRDRCIDWSALHAGTTIASYDYEANAVDGVTRQQYTDAYFAAFVSGPGRYAAVRRSGGSPELRRYFVTITEHYSPDVYEVRYGAGNNIRRR
jgi:hypothetical protein